jgi:outer membrane receptor for ferrienterochelin and colicin
MKSRFAGYGRFALLLAAGTSLVMAQSAQTIAINGQVVDNKGAVISGAAIRLKSPALQGQRTFLTDAEGRFNARLLPPGDYVIEVMKDGFHTISLRQTVGLGQTFSPRITLNVVEQVTVEVTAALPQTDKTEISTTSNFKLESVNALPMGRTMEDMLTVAPGVVDAPGNTVNGSQIRGSMSTNNRVTLDGQEVSDSIYGSRGVSVIDDAVDEIQVISGAIPAEYGDVDGGVINAVTKSGGNEYHGVFRSILSDAGWSALQPKQDKAGIVQKLNHTDSLSVGGYILKDKLWFFLAARQSKTSNSGAIGSGSPFAGAPYSTTNDDKRLQGKLTYTLNDAHSLVYAFTTHYQEQAGLDYGAGDPAALVPQINQDSSWSLSWRATWASNLFMEARVGGKKERLTGGGVAGGVDPIYDYGTGYFFGNGIFNQNDGGDNRDNRSADLKFTLVFEGLGSHQLDMGFNYNVAANRARNDQGPNSRLIFASPVDPILGLAAPSALAVYTTSDAKANTKSLGFFVNDRWSLNNRVTLNLGLRRDHYSADNTQNSLSTSASGWSPRLGVKWDIFGDDVWQVGAAFSRYNAKPLANILRAVSNSGSPTETDYPYIGGVDGNGNATFAALRDLTNYDYTSPQSYSNPSFNVRFAPNLHAPHTNEYQLSVSRTFRTSQLAGYVKLTAVKREYKDLFDYRVGNDGTVTPPGALGVATGPIYVKVWQNDPEAKREYKDLELEGGVQYGAWDLNGNVTWSSLKGNYQGESTNSPASGQGLANFTTQDGVKMYSNSYTSPYGYLVGHQPLRTRLTGGYHFDWAVGRTSIGAIYRFDSGAHDSRTRQAKLDAFNSGLSTQASPASGTFTQYENNQRGNLVYNSSAYTDLAITQDFKLFKLASANVAAFVKVTITNVFNHQQQLTYQNVWNAPEFGTLSDAFKPAPKTGTPTSSTNFGESRGIQVQAGFKF